MLIQYHHMANHKQEQFRSYLEEVFEVMVEAEAEIFRKKDVNIMAVARSSTIMALSPQDK